MLQRPSLPHTPGPQTPASPPHNPHPVPRPLSLASPCRRLCLTARKPVAASIFATCKSAATATPSLHARSAHDADSPRASPAVTPSQHGTQGPPCRRPTTRKPRRGATSTRNARPQHRQPAVHKPRHGATLTRNARSRHRRPAATPPQRAGPPHHAIPNTVRKTATATNDHNNGDDDGAAVGMVVMGDSGMAAAAMAVTARHSYYFRLYIFYLCNKWIIFLYFV